MKRAMDRAVFIGFVCFLSLSLVSGDGEAPNWIVGYPAIHATSGTSITVSVQLSEPSVVYIVALNEGAMTPTIAEVKTRTGAGGVPAQSSAAHVRFT